MSIYTIQGNSNKLSGISGASYFLGASNPSSPFYCGKPVEYGRISISNGTMYNNSNFRFTPNYLLNKNVQGIQWNFKNW